MRDVVQVFLSLLHLDGLSLIPLLKGVEPLHLGLDLVAELQKFPIGLLGLWKNVVSTGARVRIGQVNTTRTNLGRQIVRLCLRGVPTLDRRTLDVDLVAL